MLYKNLRNINVVRCLANFCNLSLFDFAKCSLCFSILVSEQCSRVPKFPSNMIYAMYFVLAQSLSRLLYSSDMSPRIASLGQIFYSSVGNTMCNIVYDVVRSTYLSTSEYYLTIMYYKLLFLRVNFSNPSHIKLPFSLL